MWRGSTELSRQLDRALSLPLDRLEADQGNDGCLSSRSLDEDHLSTFQVT